MSADLGVALHAAVNMDPPSRQNARHYNSFKHCRWGVHDKTPRPRMGIKEVVPQGGIEPPTRGFSDLG